MIHLFNAMVPYADMRHFYGISPFAHLGIRPCLDADEYANRDGLH